MKVWDQKDLIWVFLDKILKKRIAIFEGSTHEFVKAKEIHVTPKKLNLGQNSLLFGHIWIKIWKGYCHIWNQTSWIFQNVKSFVQK